MRKNKLWLIGISIIFMLALSTQAYAVTCGQAEIKFMCGEIEDKEVGRTMIIGDSLILSNTCGGGAGMQRKLDELLPVDIKLVGDWGTRIPTAKWGKIVPENIIDVHLGYLVKNECQTRTQAQGGGVIRYGTDLSVYEYCEVTDCVGRWFSVEIRKGDTLIMNGGTNDIFLWGMNTPHQIIVESLGRFIDYVESISTDITMIFLTIPPRKSKIRCGHVYSDLERIEAVNNAIKEYVTARGKSNLYILDFHNELLNNEYLMGDIMEGGAGPGYDADGTHFAEPGCDFMAELIKDKMIEVGLTE